MFQGTNRKPIILILYCSNHLGTWFPSQKKKNKKTKKQKKKTKKQKTKQKKRKRKGKRRRSKEYGLFASNSIAL